MPPWGRWSKIRARRWPRPVPASKAKSPRCRLRSGGNGADVQVPCTRHGHRRPLARARFRWRPAAMGGACGATPRLAAAGCAKACRPRLWRFSATTSRRTVHRHAVRPRYGASTPRLKYVAGSSSMGRSRLSLGCWPCPRQGASRYGRHAEMPSRPCLHSGAGGPCVLGLS